jgi:transposase
MRGADIQQAVMFKLLVPKNVCPVDHPLRAIREFADQILAGLSDTFDEMYSTVDRRSIAPEKLLRALLVQVLYSVRSERLLMEELNYNLLFSWFVGLNMDDAVWHSTV